MTAIRSSIRIALETLRLNPLRTTLSTLGIIMGAASLAAVLALADGGERLARESIERQGLSSIFLRPQTERIVDGLRLAQTSYPVFTEADAQRLAETLGPRASVLLTNDGTGTIEAPGQRTRAVRIVGRFAVNQQPSVTASSELASGRAMTEADTHGKARVAVINERLAQELTKAGLQGSKPGETLTLGGQTFDVIGVQKSPAGENIFSASVPLEFAEAIMAPAPAARPRALTVTALDVSDVTALKQTVEGYAASQPGWDGRFTVVAYGQERLEQAARGMLIFKMLMGAFTGISLAVGGIGIMNVLLASILERTREIGIRKAVGARRRDVLRQFLVESMTISIAGTAAGVGIGLAFAFIATAIIRAKTGAPMQAAVTWQTLAVTGLAAVGIGLAAGVYPAMRASRLTTIDAIQRE